MSAPGRLLLLAAALAAGVQRSGGTEQPEPALWSSSSDIVHPVKVDESGSFLSYDLSHRALHRRSLSSKNKFLAFYELHYKGQPLKFNLSLNINLLTPGFVSERRYGGIADAKIQSHTYNSCHMIGEVQSRTLKGGLAALSTCDGLKGVFQLMNEDYFIEPVATSFPEDAAAQPHRIYKRHAPEHPGEQDKKQPAAWAACGVQESQESLEKSEKRRERWEQKQYRKRRIKQRSISKEKWVETLVVADTKMIEYHGSENIEKYVLTVMNMVAGLFHHASIGNPINIAIVRLILLENEEEDLKISHHADNTLKSFCKWQKSINVKGDSHPLHHDVAVLLTRKDICAAMNRPCETLGLSHVAGMCQPHRSCNINEDTGLPLAFTVAHELGHSFGIQHDGSSNDCEPVGKRPFIMSPQLLYDTSPLTWSRCSREYITRFLDRGWGLCLDDPPAREVLDFPLVPPGVLYDVSHQCRLQYGAYSTFCDDMDSVCNTLWCTVGTTCHSKLDAAVDGTTCGENKWCFNGECVPVGYRPDAINGNWGPWSSWAACSRSCGAGVQSAERQCNNPTPKYGGRYCLGERKRFRICNIKPCPPNKPSFRQVQCSQFNPMLYKGKLYKWTPVPNNINPCELHCRPEDEYFAEKLRDAVIDGTPCYEMNSSRDMCINGICKNVGCDYEIDSNAVEDRCGVCHGDGSTCHTVKKTFEDSEGLGYVDIGIIPVGAREIRIEEVAEAGNFLALRSEDPEKYFLNGGWTIQWNGDYRVAGTTFTYERTGNWENLTSPGPTVEPVWIQLLFQETNPGVRYQYTIQRPADSENEIERAEFLWRFGSWTTCTATCGTGVQRQIVHCVEKLAGIVEEQYCDTLTRPDDKQRTCNEEPCPARWWVGEWQKCSATCGTSGLMKRTVLCIQSVGLDEQRALQQADCQHLSKPEATAPCHRDVPCPSQWAMGNWSECSATCGNGTQRRPVYCSNNTQATCDPAQRPSSETICSLPQCQKKLDNANTDWSGSGSSSREIFNEINYIPNNHIPQFNPIIPNIPESNDVNMITEDDFSARKGNFFVDDFYYDYNFINFHEDLSYYPFTEKETKSEGPMPEWSSNNVEESPEMPVDVLHTRKLGGGEHEEDLVKQNKANASTPVHGKEETESGGLVFNNLFGVFPDGEEMGTATSSAAAPALTRDEGEELPVPYSKDPLPTQPAVSHVSTSSLLLPKLSLGATLVGTSPAWDAPAHSLDSWAPTSPSTPLPIDRDSPGAGSTPDGLQPVGEPANRVQDRASTVAPDSAGSTKEGHKNSREMGFVITGDNNSAASKTKEQEEWAEIPALAGTAHTHAAPVTEEQLRVTDKMAPNSPTARSPQQEMGRHVEGPSENPHPVDATMGPGGEAGQQAGNHSHLSLMLAPLLATTTSLPPVPLSPTTLGPLTQLTAGDLMPQGALVPDMPPSPAHSPPTGASPSKPSAVPGAKWGPRATQVPYHTVPASPSTQQHSSMAPVSHTAPEEHSLPAAPGTLVYGAGEHEGPQPTPTSPPVWEQEEALLLPPTTIAATAVPSWEVGNWSECSATCGVGAIWRSVRCSTGTEEHCTAASKPVPARRCSLRPCSSWRVGNWSKCSKNCGRGTKVRDVHCVDTREQRLLRPFHCQAVLYKPLAQLPCQNAPCLDWYTSSWRECSEPCGGGEQERLVTCPELGHCDETLRPNNTRPCNSHPCTKWVVGSWGQCSVPCGGGIQRRQVKCINTQTGQAQEDSSLCDHEPWPESTQKCNLQNCEGTEAGFVCERDRLTFGFCQTLRVLGRCHLPTVHVQCCQSCRQHGHHGAPDQDRGDERASRR
ncbi:A disintegrin and metalloproteinase with thrombospondin motifs 7 isoform X2 [Phasianus colchicus]|uniref:A disintegrin and metalloproteinase with thrombospondin motifs 7 isoform X2 n=1 Tax=Phasianus colchicus TaxID=9054 RepID=UPI00129E5B24|nr:A disintegrin and metalloproteinase with thrombospondin motifs 7 isoform X2 [Phasianus colchicus]